EPLLVFITISIIGIIYIYFRIGNWSESGTALMVGLFASFTFFRRKDIFYREQESAHHPVFDNLLPIGNIIPVTALAIMGRLLYQNPGVTVLGHGFTGIPAFFILQIIVGICGGILLNMLVSGADSSDSISIILVSVTALMSGISTTLSFSPLFVGTITGAFLINSTLKRLETLQALNDPHEIIEKIFMFSLGTMVTPLLSILRLKLAFIFFCALGLFALRAVIKYVLTTVWFSRSIKGSTESPALWIGLTGQGILAAGAVMECSFPIPQFHSVFLCYTTLLIFNQIAVVLYIWFTEKNRRMEDSGNA
ncbi:hypothetical protein LLG96_03195, partial [bacterium]|nr:hypothetical protein [bacterium]